MSFQLDELRKLGQPVVRVVVAATQGSVPREVGASMLVLPGRVVGTIGGGALEYEAIKRARDLLEAMGADRLDCLPLGPGLGQCCGGSVTLLTEIWDQARLASVGDLVARACPGARREMPLVVKRVLSSARNAGQFPEPMLTEGWMVEPILHPDRDIWIWGAGHVGRALVGSVAPLSRLQLHWADSDQQRFPDETPEGVETLVASNPADLVSLASPAAEHFVLTYSHALDLEICHRVLSQPFTSLGLIGSVTKRARFRKRLASLGHSDTLIDRMVCPIGDPALGKHPQAIALGVATALLKGAGAGAGTMEYRA